MQTKNLITGLVLIFLGFLLLYANNDIALSLKDNYLSYIGVTEMMEMKIFENYSNMILIIGGILFYKGINIFTKWIFLIENKKDKA